MANSKEKRDFITEGELKTAIAKYEKLVRTKCIELGTTVEAIDNLTKQKTTLRLNSDLMQNVEKTIKLLNCSIDTFVERAIKEAILKEERRRKLAEIEEAAKDPLFIKDIEETMSAFSLLDAESLNK